RPRRRQRQPRRSALYFSESTRGEHEHEEPHHQQAPQPLTRRAYRMNTFIHGEDPSYAIGRMADALSKIGITLPETIADTPQPVTVPDPENAEIAAAIKAAKGDPAADKEVQRLITARAINRGRYTNLIARAAREEQWDALKESRGSINDQIHDVFATAASELEAVAPELKGYRDLDSIVLASLPARAADPARRALNAQHALRAARAAWLKLWRSVGGQQDGRPEADILAICNPSPDEWLTHSSRRPNSLPAPGDVWGTVQAGFTLDLAHDIRAAKARYDRLSRSIDGDREKRRLEYGRAKSWGVYRCCGSSSATGPPRAWPPPPSRPPLNATAPPWSSDAATPSSAGSGTTPGTTRSPHASSGQRTPRPPEEPGTPCLAPPVATPTDRLSSTSRWAARRSTP